MKPVRVVALAGCGIALGAAVTIARATSLWKRTTRHAMATLACEPRDGPTSIAFSERQLSALPGPVARYFRFALTPGQSRIRQARFEQTGTMRSDATRPWSTFRAVEEFAVRPPGFVWDASMPIVPFVAICIRDSYLRGEGASEAKIAGLVSVGALRGTPAAASASLVRYLAEAPWFPTALLPSDALTWTPIDDWSARATLTDATTSVFVDVRFGVEGGIASVSTLRHRDVDGVLVLTPWGGRYTDYRSVAGMMIPVTAEVEWILPDGPMTCWRGTITAAEYAFYA